MKRVLSVVVGMVLMAVTASAQKVTITKAGQPPVTIDCAVPTGCTIQVDPSTTTPPPVTCAFTVTPLRIDMPADAGVATTSIEASAPTCAWTATTAAPWVTLSDSTGNGSDTLTISAQTNTSSSRTATLTIAGHTVAVTQAAGTQPPQTGGVIFKATYAQAAYPALGWGASEPTTTWTRTALPTGSATGGFAVRHAGVSGAAGQANWGNRATVDPEGDKVYGSRFYRFRMKMDGNHRGGGWGGGGSGSASMTNKLLIVGQSCGNNCRFILTYQTDSAGIRNFRIQKDGGADLADTGSYANGVWLNVQIELIRSASSTGGGYRIWVNNKVQSSPTAQRTGIALTNANHGYVWFGGFMNDGLATGGTHSYDHSAFEIGSAFDPNW